MKSDYDFTILTSRLSKSSIRKEKKNNICILRVGLGFRFDKYLYPIIAFFKIFSIRKDIDLIHCVMESYAGLCLLFFRVFDKKIPALLTLQSGNVKMPKFLFKRIHRAPDRIQAISKYTARRAKNFGAKNIDIIPNGINLSDFRNNLDCSFERAANHKIICVAYLFPKKGIKYLLRAMPCILERFSDAKLVLVGDGPERKNLEQAADNLGIKKYIEFKEKLNFEQTKQELLSAEVFVLPSVFEGQGIVILEAQASLVPVVASNIGGIPDIVKNNKTGILVEPKNPKLISDAVIKLFSDKDFAEYLADNAFQKLQKYDWKIISKKVNNLYKELLK